VRVDELLQEAAHNAATDPLTGLANSRAFADAFALETSRRARAGCPGALLVVDCDRFKAVNDRHGHAAGDRVLCRVAEILLANVRDVDTPARLGGDEFAVLLSAPAPGAAPAIGERIRRAARDGEDADCTTLSIGIVELAPDASIALSAALAAADLAMYRAKASGGDRVSVGTLPEQSARRPPERPVALTN
jgi:diguanylate cyclase (GGDEF)-like protein